MAPMTRRSGGTAVFKHDWTLMLEQGYWSIGSLPLSSVFFFVAFILRLLPSGTEEDRFICHRFIHPRMHLFSCSARNMSSADCHWPTLSRVLVLKQSQ